MLFCPFKHCLPIADWMGFSVSVFTLQLSAMTLVHLENAVLPVSLQDGPSGWFLHSWCRLLPQSQTPPCQAAARDGSPAGLEGRTVQNLQQLENCARVATLKPWRTETVDLMLVCRLTERCYKQLGKWLAKEKWIKAVFAHTSTTMNRIWTLIPGQPKPSYRFFCNCLSDPR